MTHIPVLLNEVRDTFDYLKDRDGYFVDGTLGAGGHSLAIAKKQKGEGRKQKVVAIDKDESALNLAKKNIEEAGFADQFILVHNDFRNIDQILTELGIEKINGALLDLGVSSMQLDQSERGFSFQNQEAPLDMRMDRNQTKDAAAVLNNYTQKELGKLFFEVGEERHARSIAKNIAKFRKDKRIEKVCDLLAVLKQSIPPKVQFGSKKHFATNVFRALRIEVNEELLRLDKAVESYVNFLEPGSRLAVITFHSTEDRIIKETFRTLANPCVCPPDLPVCACGRKPTISNITKKPIIPTDEEISVNPRSRSAKLRVVQKI